MPKRTPPIAIPDGHKFCWECHTAKPVSDFHKDCGGPSGLRPYCRPCNSIVWKRSYHRRRLAAALGAGLVSRQETGAPVPTVESPRILRMMEAAR